jgi:pimeloyl-ACP methyl ester carboxylesterase
VLGKAAARDLAKVVAREHNGVAILDMLTGLSIGTPHLAIAITALHKAAAGDMTALNRLAAGVHRAEVAYKAGDLSQGLHAATLCADTPLPWTSDDLFARRLALRAAGESVQTAPYDVGTATGNGIAQQCLYWPPTALAPKLPANLPNVPTLILAGTKDLSTPMEWAGVEKLHAPGGKLIEVPGAGHSVQSQDRPEVKKELAAFF